mmetsp:Transcript_18110/g.31435  ORF Transcript_18110/g.31435 Transcript_18110/m.31435 type:complete len:228 (-) Transcript_18110:405-1088(-)
MAFPTLRSASPLVRKRRNRALCLRDSIFLARTRIFSSAKPLALANESAFSRLAAIVSSVSSSSTAAPNLALFLGLLSLRSSSSLSLPESTMRTSFSPLFLAKRLKTFLVTSSACSASIPSSSRCSSNAASVRERLPKAAVDSDDLFLVFSRLDSLFIMILFSRILRSCSICSSSKASSSSSSSPSSSIPPAATLASSSRSSSKRRASMSGSTKSAMFLPSTISGITS